MLIDKSACLSIMIICLFTSVFSRADDAGALADKLARLHTFSGTFRQVLRDDTGNILQEESSGTFVLQRPGYFRWQTLAPFPQLLVSDLKSIWLYDPDLKVVTIRAYNNNLSQTPALLLSGNVSDIKKHYRVKQETVSTAATDSYLLTPIVEPSASVQVQQPFTALNIRFTHDQLTTMALTDDLHQVTTFYFDDIVYNQTVPKDQFVFTPPSGTDVIIED